MHRDKFTAKLRRILELIDSNSLPGRIKEIYVFGSYARGAIEPNDLDLIVVYDGLMPELVVAETQKLMDEEYGELDAARMARKKVRRDLILRLRKPQERVHVILVVDLDEIVGPGSRIEPSDLVLLWSNDDRNWEPKLNSIVPDDKAGRAPRNHLIALTRVYDGIGTMERVVAMIDGRQLLLNRIPIVSIDARLSDYHDRTFNRWARCKVMGRKSLEVLPFAMWWLQQHGEECDFPLRTEMYSASRRCRIDIGRPSLAGMVYSFDSHPNLLWQCLIPHIKRKDANELLIFERGPNWRSPGMIS